MKKKILRTHIPFMPKIWLHGNPVYDELLEQIEKEAKRYKKDIGDFSASFELLSDGDGGHFLLSQVTYEKGKLE